MILTIPPPSSLPLTIEEAHTLILNLRSQRDGIAGSTMRSALLSLFPAVWRSWTPPCCTPAPS